MAFKSCAKSLRPEGEYECICHACKQTETLRGEPVIQMEFIIRTDIEQPCAGQHIFKSFYTDENGAWPDSKIGRYANSLGIPDGEDFELSDLSGRCCVVVTRHFDAADGTKKECIFFTKPSVAKAPDTLTVNGFEDITADDCPFI